MAQGHELVSVSVALSSADYRVYVAAARMLAHIMAGQAPAAAVIIQAQISGRNPAGIADEYLDSAGCPSR